MFNFVLDDYPQIDQPLSAKYKKSFAYVTFKDRVPAILQSVIDHLKDKNEISKTCGQAALNEVDEIISKISQLKSDMQLNKPLADIKENGMFSTEVSVYNKLIKLKTQENEGNPPTWFQTEWLFGECYLYFKLHEIFCTSKTMSKFDPFLKSKVESLLGSRDTIAILSNLWAENKAKTNLTEVTMKNMFTFYLKCALWGNKADLSLSLGKAVSADEDTFVKISDSDNLILVNDMESVYQLLHGNKDNVIDIVLDNAGYELVNDLFLADFLIWSGMASKIIFHGKPIPWFVSDVTPLDMSSTLKLLEAQIKSEYIRGMTKSWEKYFKEGKWVMKYESFWILPHDFSQMAHEDPELYSALGQNRLVIFKGDLNYRKLMGDIFWDPTTPFRTALRGFGPTNVLALRTIKADTISGLRKRLFEDLGNEKSATDWMVTGKYALIQFDGN